MRSYWSGLVLSFHFIRRRLVLMLGVCLLISFLGQAVASSLSDAFSDNGRGLERLRIAFTGNNAADVASLAEQITNVGSYCTFEAMEETQARDALSSGEISAVLLLPDHFLNSIYSGENITPTLFLDERRPLEGYLARWAGENAIGVLMDVQAGISTITKTYDKRQSAGFPVMQSRKQTSNDIEFLYIQQALNRGDLYRSRTVSPTGSLAPGAHYALSAVAYLGMLAGGLFFPIFDERTRRGFYKRLQSAGRSLFPLRFASFSLCIILCILLLETAIFALTHVLPPLWSTLAGAVFIAGLSGICSIFCGHASTTSITLFLFSTLSLFTSGGLLPPALLPATIRAILPYSPVRLLALALSPAYGYEAPFYAAPLLAAIGIILYGLSLFILTYRHQKGAVR